MPDYRIVILLFLLNFCCCFSQSFEFDRVLEYDYKIVNENGIQRTGRNYVFLNTANNTYKLIAEERNGNIYMQMVAADKIYYSSIPRDNFFVEALSFRCPHTHNNLHADSSKEYTFAKEADTILNTVKCSYYTTQPLNEKKFRKGKVKKMHYIIQQHADFPLPVVSPTIGSYKAWQAFGDIPAGIINQWYETNYEGEIQSYNKLVQVIKAKKYILIENKDCK